MIDNEEGNWTISLSATVAAAAATTAAAAAAIEFWCTAGITGHTGHTHGTTQTATAAAGTRQTGPIGVFVVRQSTVDDAAVACTRR